MQSRISWFCWSKRVVVKISIAIEGKLSRRKYTWTLQATWTVRNFTSPIGVKYGRMHGWAAFRMQSGYTCVVHSWVHCTVHPVCAWIVHGAPHLVNKRISLTLEAETSFLRGVYHSTWSCNSGYPSLWKKWTKLATVDSNSVAKHFFYPVQAMHGAIIHALFRLVNELHIVKWHHPLRDASAS